MSDIDGAASSDLSDGLIDLEGAAGAGGDGRRGQEGRRGRGEGGSWRSSIS